MPAVLPPTLLAVLALVLAMGSVQIGASLAKGMFFDLGPLGTTAVRLLVAAGILILWHRPWRALSAARNWPALAGYGLSLGGMNLLFYLALAHIPQGTAVALEFVGPLGLAVLSSRRAVDWLWAGLAGLGVLLLSPLTGLSGLEAPGVGFALAAGGCWALYLVFGTRISRGMSGGVATSLGMAIAATVAVPAGASRLMTASWSPGMLGLGLAVGVLSSVVPYSLEMMAMKRLSAATMGLMMSMGPAVAALSGALLLAERLSAWQVGAIALVMIASVGSTATLRRPRWEANPEPG